MLHYATSILRLYHNTQVSLSNVRNCKILRFFTWKTKKVKETKNIPRQKLVKGDEVVEPREMSLKAPKSLLKWDGRISWIVKCKYSHNFVLIEAPETFFLN